MTKLHIQFAGLVTLGFLAAAVLFLMGYSFIHAVDHMSPDGKVPIVDAGVFSTGWVAFQTVVGRIGSIWESQERTAFAEGLSNSTPTQAPNPPTGDNVGG